MEQDRQAAVWSYAWLEAATIVVRLGIFRTYVLPI